MKKFLMILAGAALLLLLMGCTHASAEGKGEKYFVAVENGPYYYVVYQRDTKVMYAVSDGVENRGNFTLLVNADGSPMLWEVDG